MSGLRAATIGATGDPRANVKSHRVSHDGCRRRRVAGHHHGAHAQSVQFGELPYADVCENNELRTYCISTSRYRLGMAERFHNL
jgi:hypothetical protein